MQTNSSRLTPLRTTWQIYLRFGDFLAKTRASLYTFLVFAKAKKVSSTWKFKMTEGDRNWNTLFLQFHFFQVKLRETKSSAA